MLSDGDQSHGVCINHLIIYLFVSELANLDRSVIINGDSTMPAIKEEDESDHNDMLYLCSELIRSSATKIKGWFFFCLFTAI